jgi:glycerophosphoryl diester phosphodiesterase
VQQRLPSLLDPPVAFAHRGASAHAPENTLEAFTLALRLGATGLESDVWVTADGVPVLDHDGVVGSRLRRRSIGDLTRDRLPSHIPTLRDLFDTCGDQYHLSLDLKDAAAGAAVLDELHDATAEFRSRVWLCHRERAGLVELRERAAGVKLLESTRLEKIKEGPERRAADLAAMGLDGINMHHTDWNGGLVALFHRFGLFAFGWDMQYEHVLRPAFRMGLDAVYSDHTDVMMEAYRAEIGSPEPI